MKGFRKNEKNLHFWAFWSKMANFGQFLDKMAKTMKIMKTTAMGLSATYKEKELFRLQKQTSNDRSTHFIDLIIEKSI